MGPGPGSQARNDAAHARMAHRDRSALVCEAGGVWARPQATAPTRHLVEVYQDVWLAGCRGDLGGARSRDSALPPGRPRCGQRARLSLSPTGGRSGERLPGGDSRAAAAATLRRRQLNHLNCFPSREMSLEHGSRRWLLGSYFRDDSPRLQAGGFWNVAGVSPHTDRASARILVLPLWSRSMIRPQWG